MEFDKSKVYTALNADEVKVGSKGYFADNLSALKRVVEQEDTSAYGKLDKIYDDSCSYRFLQMEELQDYALFYLVEEAKEKTIRPYKDTDEMIEDFKRRFNANIPFIWIKSKGMEENKHLITRFSDADKVTKVTINLEMVVYTIRLYTLFDDYTYLDGSPCGIEEYL